MIDQTEMNILAGAVAALRKRADRQRKVAAQWGEGSGEAAIALRLAAEFDELADEFSREVASPIT
jgi:NTP pyrophosphatase (non-canonical NTP hydrolase)